MIPNNPVRQNVNQCAPAQLLIFNRLHLEERDPFEVSTLENSNFFKNFEPLPCPRTEDELS